MISMCYCPDHDDPVVVAAGECDSATHLHEDGYHECECVRDIDEPNLSGQFPGETADHTVVNDCDEWFTYLAKYIP